LSSLYDINSSNMRLCADRFRAQKGGEATRARVPAVYGRRLAGGLRVGGDHHRPTVCASMRGMTPKPQRRRQAAHDQPAVGKRNEERALPPLESLLGPEHSGRVAQIPRFEVRLAIAAWANGWARIGTHLLPTPTGRSSRHLPRRVGLCTRSRPPSPPRQQERGACAGGCPVEQRAPGLAARPSSRGGRRGPPVARARSQVVAPQLQNPRQDV
jgi:hypothetical protein